MSSSSINAIIQDLERLFPVGVGAPNDSVSKFVHFCDRSRTLCAPATHNFAVRKVSALFDAMMQSTELTAAQKTRCQEVYKEVYQKLSLKPQAPILTQIEAAHNCDPIEWVNTEYADRIELRFNQMLKIYCLFVNCWLPDEPQLAILDEITSIQFPRCGTFERFCDRTQKEFPQVLSLDLSFHETITEKAALAIQTRFPNLKTLKIDSSYVPPALLNLIRSSTTIRNLVIQHLRALAQHSSTLENRCIVCNYEEDSRPDFPIRNYGKSLVVQIPPTSCYGTDHLNFSPKFAPPLNWAWYSGESAARVQAESESNKNTVQIETLENKHLVTDDVIFAAAERSMGLRDIVLDGCSEITDRALDAISFHCERRASVHYPQCDVIFLPDGTQAHSMVKEQKYGLCSTPYGSALRTISLSGCANVTDIAVCRLLEHGLSSLQELNLCHCSNLTNQVLQTIKELRTISSLNLLGCAGMTVRDEDLQMLIRTCKFLRKITLPDGTCHDENAIYALQEQMRTMTINS